MKLCYVVAKLKQMFSCSALTNYKENEVVIFSFYSVYFELFSWTLKKEIFSRKKVNLEDKVGDVCRRRCSPGR